MKKFTILTTNDMHSSFTGSGGTDYDLDSPERLGGYSRLATTINILRKHYERLGHHVLLLDSGDFYSGSLFQLLAPCSGIEWAPEIEFFSLMQYDAITLGNHDFEAGEEALLRSFGKLEKQNLKLKIVSANMRVRKIDEEKKKLNGLEVEEKKKLIATQIRERVNDYIIINRGDIKFGIIGAMGPDAIFSCASTRSYISFIGYAERNHQKRFNDYVKFITETAKKVRHNVDVLILVAHQGTPEDTNLAKAIPAGLIDIMISGHTHETYIRHVKGKQNILEFPKTKHRTVITQSGSHGKRLGVNSFGWKQGEKIVHLNYEGDIEKNETQRLGREIEKEEEKEEKEEKEKEENVERTEYSHYNESENTYTTVTDSSDYYTTEEESNNNSSNNNSSNNNSSNNNSSNNSKSSNSHTANMSTEQTKEEAITNDDEERASKKAETVTAYTEAIEEEDGKFADNWSLSEKIKNRSRRKIEVKEDSDGTESHLERRRRRKKEDRELAGIKETRRKRRKRRKDEIKKSPEAKDEGVFGRRRRRKQGDIQIEEKEIRKIKEERENCCKTQQFPTIVPPDQIIKTTKRDKEFSGAEKEILNILLLQIEENKMFVDVNNSIKQDDIIAIKMRLWSEDVNVAIIKSTSENDSKFYNFKIEDIVYKSPKSLNEKDIFPLPQADNVILTPKFCSLILEEINLFHLGTCKRQPIDLYLHAPAAIRDLLKPVKGDRYIVQYSDIFRLLSMTGRSPVCSFYLTIEHVCSLLELIPILRTFFSPEISLSFSDSLSWEERGLGIPFVNKIHNVKINGKIFEPKSLVHVATNFFIGEWLWKAKEMSKHIVDLRPMYSSGDVIDFPERNTAILTPHIYETDLVCGALQRYTKNRDKIGNNLETNKEKNTI